MPPLLLHTLLLLLPAIPLLVIFLQGQPGHQATAAAWAVGLLFLAGLWLVHVVLSTVLILVLRRSRPLNSVRILVMHAASQSLPAGFRYSPCCSDRVSCP